MIPAVNLDVVAVLEEDLCVCSAALGCSVGSGLNTRKLAPVVPSGYISDGTRVMTLNGLSSNPLDQSCRSRGTSEVVSKALPVTYAASLVSGTERTIGLAIEE